MRWQTGRRDEFRLFFHNRTFKRMLGSYIFIIVLCFLAYSGIVIYEAVTVRREQVEQLYDMKLQEMRYAMDNQLIKAEAMVSSINKSYLIRRFYVGAVQEKSVDGYLLYQLLNELQSQKAAGESLYIYDIALFFYQYGRAYTGGSVISLSEKEGIEAGKDPVSPLQVSTLNHLYAMNNPELLFYKEFLIYRGLYQYYTGPARGQVCVLFDLEGIKNMLTRLSGEETGWSVFYCQQELINGGLKDGIHFSIPSRVNPQISYGIVADPLEFGLPGGSIWLAALAAGMIVCLCYVLLACVFTYRYYKPWSSLKSLIGTKPQEAQEPENEMSRIVVEVKNLAGERDNYKEQMIILSPYAKKGILHSMLSGNWDGGSEETGLLQDYMKLENMYFLTAAISLAFTGEGSKEKEELGRMKRMLRQEAEAYSNSSARIVYQDQEAYLGYLIVNSDAGESIEDLLYDYFFSVRKKAEESGCVLTMGVDEVREQVFQLKEACLHSRQALKGMMTGGRGEIYFYEHQEEDMADYYFPRDAVRSLVKLMKDQDRKGLDSFLEILEEKNRRDHDLSLTAIQLLEDELYMSTVKAIRSIASICTLEFRVEKPMHAMTFEEIKDYYRQVYETVCGQMQLHQQESSQLGPVEQEIFQYVDQNYTNGMISLADITETFHVSNKYVSYIFKRQFGITYLQYVQEKRIACAVRLLRTTDDTMEKIAEACGYHNLLTFRRNFKAIMGENPSDFQRK